MIAQIVVFFHAKLMRKDAFRSAKIAQKFCEWKPYSNVVLIFYCFLVITVATEAKNELKCIILYNKLRFLSLELELYLFLQHLSLGLQIHYLGKFIISSNLIFFK